MNISYRWLKALAPGLTETPAQVADRLALYGAPVDELVSLGAEIEAIVIGRVERVEKHPNADRLSLCTVDAGIGEPLQVVCGAPNVRPGTFYPFAPVGAALPGGIRIRRSKIRGVESQGMLCSERELGLGREHGGIMELHGEFTPGEPFVPALGLDDVRIVIDVTPNRPDLLSHLGVARELAPGGNDGLELPAFPRTAAGAIATTGAIDAAGEGRGGAELRLARADRQATAGGLRISLDDPRGCPRYLGAVIRGIKVEPSPEWLAARLRAVGLRPINNVVDATNYILFELGQPLHAFDLERLGGAEVRIRKAAAGEKITTLDGVDRILTEEMTVIADVARPVAVAGIMGGSESEVTEETREIFLECALFDPGVTRKTRTALGLSTDASYRFERGVDPEGMELALLRAIDLIVAVAGGEVESAAVDLYPAPRPIPVVPIRAERTTRILGVPFDVAKIVGLLEPLGFQRATAPATSAGAGVEAGVSAEENAGTMLHFRVPGYRLHDISREADLIEEVARRYGYERFPAELGAFRPGTVPDDPMASLEDRLRTLFVGQGFHEARLAAFVPEAEGDVAPLNPLSAAEGKLRRSLAPGLLRRVEANFAHGIRSVRLFEIGTVFSPGADPTAPPREETRLAFALTGATRPTHWTERARAYDLWDLKGLLEMVAHSLSPDLSLEPGPTERAPLAGSRALRVVSSTGELYGWGGEVAARAIDAPAWADTVYVGELRLSPELARAETPRFRPIPAFPAIERDMALLVPDDLPAAGVAATIREAGGALLEDLFPFDLFQGAGVPAGSRSIAYRLRFRALDRTLTDREVDKTVDRILARLLEERGVTRRG
jgi:phenylalanyl-tRNA synthetase beta chain